MANWLYNGMSYPELPDWTKSYKYITLHDPNLGSSFLVVTNTVEIVRANNATYGTWYDTKAIDALISNYASGVWGEPSTIGSIWLIGNSHYVDHSTRARWSNFDIYCKYKDGTEYLALAGSKPVNPNAPVITGMSVAPFDIFMLGQRLRPGLMGLEIKPVASMYFYPSVVLPDIESVWTDKETYPYAYLMRYGANKEQFCLMLTTKPCTGYSGCFGTAQGPLYYLKATLSDLSSEWSVESPYYASANNWNSLIPESNVFWVSHDSYGISATTPVPAGNGMAAYKGVKLPKLPDVDHGIAMIYESNQTETYRLVLAKKFKGWVNWSNGTIPVTNSIFNFYQPVYEYDLEGDVWVEVVASNSSSDYYVITNNMIGRLPVWASRTLAMTEGVVCEGFDPIPVYSE